MVSRKRKLPEKPRADSRDEEHIVLIDLLAAIENRSGGRSDGGFGLYNHEQLYQRLDEVLFSVDDEEEKGGSLAWLRRPLIQGLLHGGARINRKVVPPITAHSEEGGIDMHSRSQPLIHCLCEWKLLKHVFGWEGRDDMVLLALRAGASVEQSHPDADMQSILSGVIQYGTVHTLKHLIYAVHHKGNDVEEWITTEFILHGLWSLLLDRACPHMLSLLLRYMPATEPIWVNLLAFEGMVSKTTEEIHVTSVDYMLQKLWIWCVSHNPDIFPCLCWSISGAPHVQDYGSCIMLLMKNGVTCTSLTMELLNRFLFTDSTTVPRQYAYTIAQLFFGNWLPTKTQKQFLLKQRPNLQDRTIADTDESVCVICLEENKKDVSHSRKSWFDFKEQSLVESCTTLYCGHQFCSICILEWGASEPEINVSTRTWELGCPICRKPLPREFLSDTNRSWFSRLGDRRRNTLGLEYHPVGRGPEYLTPTQIAIECEARGLSIDQMGYDACYEELVKQWNWVKRQRRHGPNIMVDVGASETLSPHYVAPKYGPVVIPILVENIPVLAGISGASPYTVVTPYLAQALGLVTKNLTSNQFQKLKHDESCGSEEKNGGMYIAGSAIKKCRTRMAVVDKLAVTLGASKIEVHMRNAIVDINEGRDEDWRPGIVLGLDFFKSAAWTQLAVEVDVAQSLSTGTDSERDEYFAKQRFMVVLHGGQNIYRVSDTSLAKKMSEEFRYYAFNGRTFQAPIWHIRQFFDDDSSAGNGLFFSVGYASTSFGAGNSRHRFTECEWCCRMFPLVDEVGDCAYRSILSHGAQVGTIGMIRCKVCCDTADTTKHYVYYCDDHCRRKASEVHFWRHWKHRSSLMSGCHIIVALVVSTLRKQWKSLVVWFLLSFTLTTLLLCRAPSEGVFGLLLESLPSSNYEAYHIFSS